MTPDEFWKRTTVTPGCWLWTGVVDRCGYGKLGHELAHRISWRLHKGAISSSKTYVCHSCDTPACVNPAHLFLGSQRENMADMRLKGRASRRPGEANPRATLTDDQVLAIRTKRAEGQHLKRIAAEFGTTISTVFNIAKRNTWRHLP